MQQLFGNRRLPDASLAQRGVRQNVRWLTHLLALLPAAILMWDWLNGNLSVNPVQEAIQRSGRIAITLLVATLAMRPLSHWLRQNALLAQRRPLGLYAFAYALLHVGLFLFFDYQLALPLIYQELVEKPYLWFGAGAFVILLPLAITSFRPWIHKLGKAWKRLHRWTYVAAILAVLHYSGAVKGDFLALRGEVLGPWAYGAGVAFLRAWRVWRRFCRESALHD
ncbi:MAG: protein-methionine-sulfoxide reductase heme-binding subunit MsrQ [Anaerolineales bacterium]|nr:sulfoxide reductase heme-binding subunit YedZ [Anaerolineales bacterium]MDW8446237.1 protein-methionine-sulfoxide reductase heme-binding subunit MsrQ [Anaerolineales bacterium]